MFYKEMCQGLMTRLKRVMNKLINRDRVGFIRHELITDDTMKSFMFIRIDSDRLVFASSVNVQEDYNGIEIAEQY